MDEQLLMRFLTKQCSAEDMRSIDRWVAKNRTNADWLYEIEHIWSLKDELRFSDEQEIRKSYERFLFGIRRQQPSKKRKIIRKISLSLKYAAAILFVGLLSVNVYNMLSDRKMETAINTVEVPMGQRVSLTLSDGTKVWLNAGSIFTYPSGFADKNREVSLIGEAFFEVTHDKEKIFIVHSDLMHVKVKGTKFDMKAYPQEKASVTLTEGSVEVSSNDDGYRVILKPDEQVSYSEKDGWVLSENVHADLTQSWITGELYFADKPLVEIAKSLERRFGVQIRIQDSVIADDIYTCRFRETDSLERILSLLKETGLIDYRVLNDGKIELINRKK